MDKRDEELLREIKQERHIKECCECRFYNKEAKFYEVAPCILTGYDDLNPEDWDEYAITERMYK